MVSLSLLTQKINNKHCFFYSEEFLAARTAFADELRPRTMVIKYRTLRNNYASAYAVRMSKCFLKCLVVMFFFPHT